MDCCSPSPVDDVNVEGADRVSLVEAAVAGAGAVGNDVAVAAVALWEPDGGVLSVRGCQNLVWSGPLVAQICR